MNSLLVTDKLRALVGVEGEPLVLEIEKGAVRKFAQAIEDPNPLWQDENFARNIKYGNIVVPPTFLTSLRASDYIARIMADHPIVKKFVNSGNEFEYFHPVKVGDTITMTPKLLEPREREGKLGKMLFLTVEATYRNQKGETVAKGRTTIVGYVQQ